MWMAKCDEKAVSEELVQLWYTSSLTSLPFPDPLPTRQIFENDDYRPTQVQTGDQYYGVLDLFPYNDVELAAAPYPKCFPFSGVVPQVFKQLKLFVVHCTGYADKLNLRWGSG